MRSATTSFAFEHVGADSRICYRKHDLSPPGRDELLVKVVAAGLNHADLMQRDGKYNPPAHETAIPGIEISGEVLALGRDVASHHVGDRVCGVVPGGGFSHVCKMDCGMAMPVPPGWSFEEAAAFPEAALTANEALVTLGALRPGQTVVIHAASSGIGTMLVRMAKRLEGIVIATTSHSAKVAQIQALGVDGVIDEQGINFYDRVFAFTSGVGADLTVDFLGGRYFNSNVRALRAGGTLVVGGILDGRMAEVDLYWLINKRITVLPLTLRMKSENEKRAVTERFLARWWQKPVFDSLRPLIHSVFPFGDIASALALMESSEHTGKIVISVAGAAPVG